MFTRRISILVAACCFTATVRAAEVKLLLPQNRTAFQTNEWIDVSVVRRSQETLTAGDLKLTLAGADGSKIETTFVSTPRKQVPAVAVEHLHVNGWLLRPGKYTVTAAVDGTTAATDIEVFSHIRQSSFRLINWGRAKGKEQRRPGRRQPGLQPLLRPRHDERRQLHPRRRRFHVELHHERRPPDGHAQGMRLVRSARPARRHPARGPASDGRPHQTQRARRPLLRRAGPDLGRRTRRPASSAARNPQPGSRPTSAAFGKVPPAYQKIDPKNPQDVERLEALGDVEARLHGRGVEGSRSSASARCGPITCR